MVKDCVQPRRPQVVTTAHPLIAVRSSTNLQLDSGRTASIRKRDCDKRNVVDMTAVGCMGLSPLTSQQVNEYIACGRVRRRSVISIGIIDEWSARIREVLRRHESCIRFAVDSPSERWHRRNYGGWDRFAVLYEPFGWTRVEQRAL